jgi:hypothetical protein
VFPKLKALLSGVEVMTYAKYAGRLEAGRTAS